MTAYALAAPLVASALMLAAGALGARNHKRRARNTTRPRHANRKAHR